MARRALYRKGDWLRLAAEYSAGHLNPEPYRAEARRDFARLVHSPAFRRLQGKTQLFPGDESDFFRNRLTHSLEVSQIAKSIAIRLNGTSRELKGSPINTDLIEFAALSHDIGHPPFGHNGEHALDQLMINNGGFEGNAQTLRLVSRIEKKITDDFPSRSNHPIAIDPTTHMDLRRGLNLSSRAIASILKYDDVIPVSENSRRVGGFDKRPYKGYYELEADVVNSVKKNLGVNATTSLKTIECQIMDVADDIAYSTYDVEDSFKAEFLSPITMISTNDDFKRKLAGIVQENINKNYGDKSAAEKEFNIEQVNNILASLFRGIIKPSEIIDNRFNDPISLEDAAFILSSSTNDQSRELCRNGYLRTAFTSHMVGKFIRDIEFEYNPKFPLLSKVRLSLGIYKIVETLKHFSFQLLIESPRLKLAEKRGAEIIQRVFRTLNDDHALLPEDWRNICNSYNNSQHQERTICDYIAGMTDQYCVELYSRLTGVHPPSMWKPH